MHTAIIGPCFLFLFAVGFSVRGDLVVALKNLYKKIAQFDAVIIETTGLADPAPVAQTFFVDDYIKERFSLDGIITVCDVRHIIARLDDVKPEGVENEAEEQVAFADRILLNKTDLAKDEAEMVAIEARLRKMNPSAQIYRTQQSVCDPALLIGISAFDLDRTLEMDENFLNTDEEHEHDPSVSSTSTRFEGYLQIQKLQRWIGTILRTMGANLFRYKGVLNVAGMNRKFVFQGVGMLFSGDFVEEVWAPGAKRENCFVFIGRDLDKKALIDGFMACKCSDVLRFAVGDMVLANVGPSVSTAGADGYALGKIVRQWDEGNAYLIQLQDADETQVWGPIDEDGFVKAASSAAAAGGSPQKKQRIG